MGNNTLTYKEYNNLKSKYDLNTLLRHDCMNIYKSLEDIHDTKVIKHLENKFNIAKFKGDNLIETFTETTGFLKGKEQDIKVVRKGVVESLKTIFEQIDDTIELYIPKDVYPVYEVLAKDYHKNYKTFNTFNVDNYDKLQEIKDSIILLTLPSKPVEYNATFDEIQGLVQNGNTVILDTVYLREDRYNLSEIADLKNVIILNSLSKTFIRPKTLGFVYDTSDLGIEYQEVDLDIQHYFNEIIGRANTNEILKHLIVYGWENQLINEEVDYTVMNDKYSEYNYFRCIKGNFSNLLLDQDLLTIPVSVFSIEEEYHNDYVLITPLLWLSSYLQELKK